MVARAIGSVGGIDVGVDVSKTTLKSVGEEHLKQALFPTIRKMANASMKYATTDERVVKKFEEMQAQGEENIAPFSNALDVVGLAEAANKGGLLTIGGANAAATGKFFDTASKLGDAKEIGLMISDTALLGLAWLSVRVDDMVAYENSKNDQYSENLKQAALTTFNIMHGGKPVQLKDAMFHAQTAFPDVKEEHLLAVVQRMEKEREQRLQDTAAKEIDLVGFREKKAQSEQQIDAPKEQQNFRPCV